MIVGTESTPRFTFANAESVAGSDLVSDSFVFNAGTSLGGSVSGGAGASIVDVLNTSALTGSVNLATGAATGLSGTFSGIESFVSNGGTITGPNVATSWALTGNRIGTVGYTTNSVAFSHSFSGFAVLQGGSGNDTFNVGDGGTRTTVQGGTGTDSLIGQNLQTTWEITEIGGGSFGTLMQFKQIENLTGGNNIDRFRIRSNASIPAVLDGGLGDNILDYSLFTTAVAVDLQSATPSSTNVSSLTNTFPIIMGGSGNDTLKGSRTRSSVIVGGAGIDSILGGDLGDILVGGLGADSLRGGLGEDILVGGRITFDTDVIGLRSIFLEWTRSDRTVDQRFVNLTNNTSGGGTLTSPINGNFFLRGGEDPNARTLLDDSVVDELFGGVESDWFVISASELANLAKHDRTALDKRRTPVAAGW
jgi:Ca2+-binding RTX toxin-like protein